jgi:hypothetical protein
MAQDKNFLTTLVTFLPIQVVELYLAGWTYNRFYYLPFGIDQRFFEFGPYDQASKGFALCREDGWLLVTFLIASITLPVIFHVDFKKKSQEVVRITGIFLLLSLSAWFAYIQASRDGRRDAERDLSDKSQLVSVNFVYRGVHYRGQLLGIKGETILVSRLDPFTGKPDMYDIAIYRSGDLQDLKIIGRP